MAKIHYSLRLPTSAELGEHPYLIYDKKLIKYIPTFARWVSQFPRKYAVQSGESLKDLTNFPKHMQKILKETADLPGRNITFVGIGGGSIGDFTGFVASTFKRGTRLIHIPSTWLAAIDSAHGGKTALNAGSFKNQIGTFYPANHIYITRALLKNHPEKRVIEAFGELTKIALIHGGSLWREVSQLTSVNESNLWRLAPAAIRAKYKVVNRDLYETKGERQVLNLGHTLGHILEAHYHIPHGEAVQLGLQFSQSWSHQKNLLSPKQSKNIHRVTDQLFSHRTQSLFRKLHRSPLKAKDLKKYLQQDKKRSKVDRVQFVFIQKPGSPLIRNVSLAEFVNEAQRQGFCQ